MSANMRAGRQDYRRKSVDNPIHDFVEPDVGASSFAMVWLLPTRTLLEEAIGRYATWPPEMQDRAAMVSNSLAGR
jgi:hypothetical protein